MLVPTTESWWWLALAGTTILVTGLSGISVSRHVLSRNDAASMAPLPRLLQLGIFLTSPLVVATSLPLAQLPFVGIAVLSLVMLLRSYEGLVYLLCTAGAMAAAWADRSRRPHRGTLIALSLIVVLAYASAAYAAVFELLGY